jgi:hypothetical protein
MDTLNSKTEGAEGSAPRSLQPPDAEPVTQKSGQTATHAVLFTPELLCNIINKLPLKEIITTTGVCHFWRNAVAADQHIQRALFLAPEEVRRGLFFLINDSWWDEFLSEVKSGDAIKDVTKMNACSIIGQVHPYLARICNTWFDMRGSTDSASTIGPAPNFNHPDGSWRRMFITQPPCKFVGAMADAADRTDMERFNIRYRDDDGVRLGGLYDAIVSAWSTDLFKRFRIVAWIPRYSKQGTEIEESTLEIDIKDGTGYWPEEVSWTDPIWISYMAECRNKRVSKQEMEL